jgi:hypothetical protein
MQSVNCNDRMCCKWNRVSVLWAYRVLNWGLVPLRYVLNLWLIMLSYYYCRELYFKSVSVVVANMQPIMLHGLSPGKSYPILLRDELWESISHHSNGHDKHLY